MPLSLKAFLPQDEFRILSQQFILAEEGISYGHYYELFEKKLKTLRSSFYQYTRNAYYDEIILTWCKLFGSYGEPTHYTSILKFNGIIKALNIVKNGLSDQENLKKKVTAGVDSYDQYHHDTKDYRDRYLIHREHSPITINDGDLNFPIVQPALKLIHNYYLLLIKVLKTYPKSYSEEYQNALSRQYFISIGEYLNYLDKTIPNWL
jgi:hypothetical protein